MVVVVSPHGLPRVGLRAALASKAWGGMGPAFGLVGAKGGTESLLWSSAEDAGVLGTATTFEHGPHAESEDRRPLLLGEPRLTRSVTGFV